MSSVTSVCPIRSASAISVSGVVEGVMAHGRPYSSAARLARGKSMSAAATSLYSWDLRELIGDPLAHTAACAHHRYAYRVSSLL
jgi:hypothetical protein